MVEEMERAGEVAVDSWMFQMDGAANLASFSLRTVLFGPDARRPRSQRRRNLESRRPNHDLPFWENTRFFAWGISS
eukprot:465376-Amphidinium_carterae.1